MVFTVDLSMEAPLVQLAPQSTPLLSAVKHEAFNLFSAFEPGVILSTRVGYHTAIQDLFSPTQMILVLNVIRCMFGKEFFHRQIDPHCVDVVLHKLLSLQYNAILRFLRHVIRKSLSVFVIL